MAVILSCGTLIPVSVTENRIAPGVEQSGSLVMVATTDPSR